MAVRFDGCLFQFFGGEGGRRFFVVSEPSAPNGLLPKHRLNFVHGHLWTARLENHNISNVHFRPRKDLLQASLLFGLHEHYSVPGGVPRFFATTISGAAPRRWKDIHRP
jgi:hypothetical protein